VGGTPIQNVGAYGQDVSETILQVRALDLTSGEFVDLSNADCGFSYRGSRFNFADRERFIVTQVSFSLLRDGEAKIEYADLKNYFSERTAPPTLAETRQAVLAIRHRKAMLIVDGDEDCHSAGSFFKNPVVDRKLFENISEIAAERGLKVPHYPAGEKVKIAAAWLVEQSGIHKGFTLGRVGISRRHSLAIVNRGGATAADVIALKEIVQARVRDTFGVELHPEPVFVGF
jgi:UDP-N-acetylmuramate dehydrogenase